MTKPRKRPDSTGAPSKRKMRPDVAKVRELRAAALDDARPDTVAKRRKLGRRTVRESIADLLDPDSFVEYGRLSRPARRDMEGPADGVVMGTGRVADRPVAVMAYDYTVHAGTQSRVNHPKSDRIFELAAAQRLPMICWLEGGGARPHDITAGLGGWTNTFTAFARLSGLVPTIAIVTGRCFAGNANLAGLADVLIATRQAVIGMAGPALVEEALGRAFTPEEIGPVDVHVAAGVVDILCDDDRKAVALAKQYLSHFQRPEPGAGQDGGAADQTRLRDMVPTNPREAYNVRRVLDVMFDTDSVLELRPRFGGAAVTALARLGGIPVGVIASQPTFLAGSIDSPTSDKIARFIQLCDAHDVPIVILCDTPGLMAGPDVEKTGLVRHSARILTAIANATTPVLTVVLRKAYGLGYYVMGSRPLRPAILLAWPTAEFGGMGLEGAAAIIHKAELEAAPDEAARKALHADYTERLKEMNTALAVAGRFEFDDVIDPADTRDMLIKTLRTLPAPPPRTGRKRTVDPW